MNRYIVCRKKDWSCARWIELVMRRRKIQSSHEDRLLSHFARSQWFSESRWLRSCGARRFGRTFLLWTLDSQLRVDDAAIMTFPTEVIRFVCRPKTVARGVSKSLDLDLQPCRTCSKKAPWRKRRNPAGIANPLRDPQWHCLEIDILSRDWLNRNQGCLLVLGGRFKSRDRGICNPSAVGIQLKMNRKGDYRGEGTWRISASRCKATEKGKVTWLGWATFLWSGI